MNIKWNPLKSTALLMLDAPETPERIFAYARANGFAQKPEFHISIISFQVGKKITDKYGADETALQSMLQSVRMLIDEFAWHVSYEPEYAVIEKHYDQAELAKSGYENIPDHTRKTIVQKAIVPDLAPFYERLSALTGIDFDLPFSHLTLFSWSDYPPLMTQGIGLYSEADFDACKTSELKT